MVNKRNIVIQSEAEIPVVVHMMVGNAHPGLSIQPAQGSAVILIGRPPPYGRGLRAAVVEGVVEPAPVVVHVFVQGPASCVHEKVGNGRNFESQLIRDRGLHLLVRTPRFPEDCQEGPSLDVGEDQPWLLVRRRRTTFWSVVVVAVVAVAVGVAAAVVRLLLLLYDLVLPDLAGCHTIG